VANVLKKQYPTEPWSKTTVLRVIKKTGGKFFTMPRVPWLNKEQRTERLQFATNYVNITQPMIFVDEAWVTVNASTKKGIYWWPQESEYECSPEDFNRNDQYPTKLFVFGAVGHNFKFLRIIRLVAKDRKNDDGEDKPKKKGVGMDAYVTRCLAGPVMRQLKATNSILIQDNAPAHTGARTRKYLAKQGVQMLPSRLPPKSCDLNIPIERTWANLKRLVQEDACDTVEELEASVVRNWERLSQATINKMVTAQAWKERCKDVIEAGGWYTWGKRPKAVIPT
jgi:transposase